MQIQKINNLNLSNNKTDNKPSFGMIKITSAVKDPDLIIDIFEQQGKHALGIVNDKVCHILKTSEFVEEEQWLHILKKNGFEAESISQEEGEKIIAADKEFDDILRDALETIKPLSQRIRDIMKNNSCN